jgi:hypothetical protein
MKLTTIIIIALFSISLHAQTDVKIIPQKGNMQPRLVVGIVIDQMR